MFRLTWPRHQAADLAGGAGARLEPARHGSGSDDDHLDGARRQRRIPLNPTLFFEYKFGIGRISGEEVDEEGDQMEEINKMQDMARAQRRHRHFHRLVRRAADGPEDENDGGGEDDAEAGEEEGNEHIPDAFEVRLLLSQDFGERMEWAFNIFFEQEVGGDRGREWGFAQSLATPVLLDHERLKIGLELQCRNETHRGERGDPEQSFVIGPSVALKPTRNTRLDLAPLFGATEDAPRVQAFAIFSYTFGANGEGGEAETPVSTRNR